MIATSESNTDSCIIRGAFSAKIVQEIGTGTTKRKVVQVMMYYAEETLDGNIEISLLNKNNVPSNEKQSITKEDLIEKFTPEVEVYTSKVFPAMRELSKTLAKADRQRTLGHYFTAEMEYDNARNIDETNIRANFGIGLCYLKRNENKKAIAVFEKLIKLDAAFKVEHKHLYNDFGISLRKNGLFDQAIEFYQRAITFSNDDENLYFNLSRSLFELGQNSQAAKFIKKSLSLNPESLEATKLCEAINKKTSL